MGKNLRIVAIGLLVKRYDVIATGEYNAVLDCDRPAIAASCEKRPQCLLAADFLLPAGRMYVETLARKGGLLGCSCLFPVPR